MSIWLSAVSRVGSGATLAAVQHAAVAAGLVFGVDLAARDTATVGGMASTNAGGLRTVRYGNMGEQVLGLEVALPDGSLLHRDSRVRSDNTGYDLPSLFVGAEGTLGVITALDLRLHPTPSHRVTAVCGFAVAGGACRGRPGVSRRGRDRGAGADRRAGGRADPRASRRRVARRRRLAAAGGAGRRPRSDRPARRAARRRRAVWRARGGCGCRCAATVVACSRGSGGGARCLRAAAEVRRLAAACRRSADSPGRQSL